MSTVTNFCSFHSIITVKWTNPYCRTCIQYVAVNLQSIMGKITIAGNFTVKLYFPVYHSTVILSGIYFLRWINRRDAPILFFNLTSER